MVMDNLFIKKAIISFVEVVFAVNSFARRVIPNDHRLIECEFLYISNTFRNILAVPNKPFFHITPMLYTVPNSFIRHSKSLVTQPRAPITTGTTST